MKLNVPNILVIVRLLLVPVIVLLLLFPGLGTETKFAHNTLSYNWSDMLAGALFIIASITDFVDGWWARKYDQVTTFGKLFDPLADKILVNSVLIIFSVRGIVPVFFTVLFICRDILVDGLRMMLASNNVVLAADRYGKFKTIFQMIGLSILFFIFPEDNPDSILFSWDQWQAVVIIIPVGIGLFFSIFSGVNYYSKSIKNLK